MAGAGEPVARAWDFLGHTVGVSGPTLVVEVLGRLVPADVWRPTGNPPARWWTAEMAAGGIAVTAGGIPVGTFGEAGEAARVIRSDIELWVGDHTARPVVVHAAVVEVGGRAIVLPGRSGVGKTTLARDLVRAGATYLSDEFALLEPGGWVHPYARPLSVRPPAGASAPAEHVEVTALGGRRGHRPVRVGCVAELVYDAGVADLEAVVVSEPVAVLSLMANAVAARSFPEEVLDACADAVRGSLTVAGRRGESTAAARRLLALLAGTAAGG